MKKLYIYVNGIKTRVSIAKEGDSMGNGASFFTDEAGDRQIVLGREERWSRFVGLFLHEVCEMCMAYLGYRYSKDRTHTGADGVSFFMDHEGFSEVMAICGEAVAEALPELAAEHNRIFSEGE